MATQIEDERHLLYMKMD